MIEHYIPGILAGVVSFSLVYFIFADESILEVWPRIVKYCTNILPEKIAMALNKILFYCETCMGGQIALWYGIFNGYNFFEIIVLIALAIITARLLTVKLIE